MSRQQVNVDFYDNVKLASGNIQLTNLKNDKSVKINLSDGLPNEECGIDMVIMDTGATDTTIPKFLADKLGIPTPMRGYSICIGVGGCALLCLSRHLIDISIQDDSGDIVNYETMPYIQIQTAPSVACEPNEIYGLQAKFEREDKSLYRKYARFVIPNINRKDKFSAIFESSKENFTPLNRRLELVIDQGKNPPWILIGRDWQEAFNLNFGESSLTITQNSSD